MKGGEAVKPPAECIAIGPASQTNGQNPYISITT